MPTIKIILNISLTFVFKVSLFEVFLILALLVKILI